MSKTCLLLRTLGALCCALIMQWPATAGAQQIKQVPRPPFQEVLEGLVDFNAVSNVTSPGTLYGDRLPFSGLIVATYFSGQITGLGAAGRVRHGVNYGAPSKPLQEGFGKRPYSRLHAVRAEDSSDGFVASHVRDMNWLGRNFLGHGSIVLKFTNSQYVFGFDVRPMGKLARQPLKLQVRFFDIEGKVVGSPKVLTSYGEFTFLVPGKARVVKGVEFINIGTGSFAVDDVVFELVRYIG